ncbi:uncharacterized protein V1518DRAFT_437028 [Limtongia smithiae]|uniref:uncharacterized protein n=1 Tax=Limtongia smithiae TaxID=1125753 RepID=UPI0034CDBC4A
MAAVDDPERRPNPPGWRPPRAPYNPYDPADNRPPEGYPSEYNVPISRHWRVRAGENPNYRQFVNRMRMEAFPGSAPPSELYYGRTKVLRRALEKGAGFTDGAQYASMFLCSAVIIYGTFFYRWNDGYNNVFSGPYRFQLRLKKMVTGHLSPQEEQDLVQRRSRPQSDRVIDPSTVSTTDFEGSEWALERPRRSHLLEAERARQDLEELALRTATASDFAGPSQSTPSPSKRWYQFWRS